MHKIEDYLSVPYVDGGRDMTGLDCWGQSRLVLHNVFNKPLFKSFGHVSPDDKTNLTHSYAQIVDQFKPCQPKEQAIACGFRGQSLIHMGLCVLVDGQLQILHTSRRKGPSIVKIADFKRLFFEVKFYEYTG